MHQRKSIALLIESSNAYARGLLSGISDYVQEHDSWSLYLPEQTRHSGPPSWLEGWRGDGILARIETPEMAQALQPFDVPMVDVSAGRRLPAVPCVETDDRLIAEAAFLHLRERGFRNFAFCGDASFRWAELRMNYFQGFVQDAGFEFFHYLSDTPPQPTLSGERDAVARWLAELPKPVGLMAAFDVAGQVLLDLCRDSGVAVPEEIAVVGVDNDSVLCSLCDPPLSSVIPNAQRTGYEAAAILDEMMTKYAAGSAAIPNDHAEVRLIAPLGIAVRPSSDVLAIDDVDVANAVRYIRHQACNAIKVIDVVDAIGIPRRVLESRFVKVLGRTPHEEIIRHRIQRVKQLLQETGLPLRVIAERAGFEHTEYLSVVFKRETGKTPTAFRAATQHKKIVNTKK